MTTREAENLHYVLKCFYVDDFLRSTLHLSTAKREQCAVYTPAVCSSEYMPLEAICVLICLTGRLLQFDDCESFSASMLQ